jgi:hypothetical protein
VLGSVCGVPPRRVPRYAGTDVTDSLKTRFNRAYDRQRALSEDPILIRSWFELVEQTKAKYGICDEDVYNFDEAGFMMGKITT